MGKGSPSTGLPPDWQRDSARYMSSTGYVEKILAIHIGFVATGGVLDLYGLPGTDI